MAGYQDCPPSLGNSRFVRILLTLYMEEREKKEKKKKRKRKRKEKEKKKRKNVSCYINQEKEKEKKKKRLLVVTSILRLPKEMEMVTHYKRKGYNNLYSTMYILFFLFNF